MELDTLANSIMALVMVRASKSGKIIPSMKDTGSMIEQTAVEDSFMQMEMSMRDSGKTIKRMEEVFIQRLMDRTIQANGMRTFSKVLESKNGPTDLHMKENTSKDLSMEKVNSHGLMAQFMKVISRKT